MLYKLKYQRVIIIQQTLFNKETKNTTEFEILDSIPSQLFIPYSCADSICQGDILYMNKMDE